MATPATRFAIRRPAVPLSRCSQLLALRRAIVGRMEEEVLLLLWQGLYCYTAEFTSGWRGRPPRTS